MKVYMAQILRTLLRIIADIEILLLALWTSGFGADPFLQKQKAFVLLNKDRK